MYTFLYFPRLGVDPRVSRSFFVQQGHPILLNIRSRSRLSEHFPQVLDCSHVRAPTIHTLLAFNKNATNNFSDVSETATHQYPEYLIDYKLSRLSDYLKSFYEHIDWTLYRESRQIVLPELWGRVGLILSLGALWRAPGTCQWRSRRLIMNKKAVLEYCNILDEPNQAHVG